MKQKKIIEKLNYLPALLWMGVIFYMSSQTGSESSQTSGSVITLFTDILQFFFGHTGVEFIEKYHSIFETIIRKCAHMTEYAVLFFLLWRIPEINKIKKIHMKKAIWITLFLCFAYAASDECHQLLVSERSGQILDILIDTTGAGLAALFITFLNRRLL